ncbi:DnaJ domain-containing protein [Xylaria cf. heliscus]|nr:DnaJ domain-containing protein [Xylaria cf. heliscus]
MFPEDGTINPPRTPDYYRDLGVSKEANPAAIRQAFKRLALATHPDKKRGELHDAADFRKVREAYECLSDPRKRASYDRDYLYVKHTWAKYHHRAQKEQRRREEELYARKMDEEQRKAIQAAWMRRVDRIREGYRRLRERREAIRAEFLRRQQFEDMRCRNELGDQGQASQNISK